MVPGADLCSHDQSAVSAMEYILLLFLHQKCILCPFQGGQRPEKSTKPYLKVLETNQSLQKMLPFQVIIYSQHKLLHIRIVDKLPAILHALEWKQFLDFRQELHIYLATSF